MTSRGGAEPKRGYTVGLTLFVKRGGELGLFENGLRQNVLFLYHLFRAAPDCRRVWLLNHGDGEPDIIPGGLGVSREDIVRTPDVIDALDYVIVGAAMDRETVVALRRRGCGMIAYKGGNGAVISMEASVAAPPRADAERYFDHDYYDAVWMTPQHIHTYRGWCETIYRRQVAEVPQIWSPLLVEAMPAPARARFGYRPPIGGMRVGVLDPNVTVMKTSHMPMLVCEAAFRREPDAFSAIYISNGWPHRDNDHFRSFTLAMRAARAGIMTLEPRFVGLEFLADHCDAVVTHQWENGLNYLCYEALFGDYPLIHNSEFLRDFGYYYPDFDAEAGAAALLRARHEHERALADYQARNRVLFERLRPDSPANIELHQRLLTATGAGSSDKAYAGR
ncbi:MAG: DUF2827 family protein [Caulobacterales bacterium]